MKKLLRNVVQYPVDAQSNVFIAAYASLVLTAENVNEKTPVYCGRNRRECVNCNDCGQKPMMARHHLAAYHDYVTISGIGLLWADCDESGSYDVPYKKNVFSGCLSDRLDFLMKASGYDYIRLTNADSKNEIFSQIVRSVDEGYPVLMKLGNGNDWHVVTGYDTGTRAVYGIDSHKHWDNSVKPIFTPDGYTEDELFYTWNWFDNLVCAVVIVGRTNGLPLIDIIDRMIMVLDRKENAELECKVMEVLESSDGDKTELGKWLNSLAGYSVECRWHGAESFTAKMYHLTDHANIRELLGEMTDQYLLFHDLCWNIWGLLGVGTDSGYAVSDDVGERLMNQDTVSELKQLFGKLFEIDRNVLRMLKEIGNFIW